MLKKSKNPRKTRISQTTPTHPLFYQFFFLKHVQQKKKKKKKKHTTFPKK